MLFFVWPFHLVKISLISKLKYLINLSYKIIIVILTRLKGHTKINIVSLLINIFSFCKKQNFGKRMVLPINDVTMM